MSMRTLVAVVAFGLLVASPTDAPAEWKVERSTSPIDDSETVTLARQANSPIQGWPSRTTTPILILRCKEGAINAFVHTGFPMQVGSSTVVLRFDKEKAARHPASESTDNEAIFLGSPKPLILTMLQHQRLVLRFTPFNSSPQDTSFMLAGLDGYIGSLKRACSWDPAAEAAAATARLTAREKNILEGLSSRGRLRAVDARELGEIGSDVSAEAKHALLDALRDPDLGVRMAAASAIKTCGDPEHIPLLEELAADASLMIDDNLRWAISAIRERAAKE